MSSYRQAIASKEKDLLTAQEELDGLRQQFTETESSLQSKVAAVEAQLLEAKQNEA